MPLKDDIHKFVDAHIREIQYFIYGLGLCGVVLVVKDLHLTSTFRHVSEIPQKFLSSHVTLQGRVQDVSTVGVLHVHHQPVFRLPFSGWVHRLRSSEQEKGALSVKLAGVEMTAPATQWLKQNLVNQHVWFQLLQPSDSAVSCSVHKQKNFLFKMNINEALVRQGLAPTHRGDSTFQSSADRAIQSLAVRLEAAENKAQKNRLGIWKGNTKECGMEDKPSAVRRVLHWVGRKIKETVGQKGKEL